ncbi:MAG: endolytic transglycosylase MltG [Deltaproteobacteria bacterium]|nr:endolytic transglycosylase MltG [Deltaproteobacteria bacterium]
MRSAAATVVVTLVLVAGLAFEYARFLRQKGPNTAPIAIALPPGLGAADAAELLGELGVTDSPTWLRVHFVLTRMPSCFVAGAHLLPPATARDLGAMLCRSSSRPLIKITFPEGAHRFGMAEKLAAQGVTTKDAFLGATADRALLGSLGVDPPAHDDPGVRAALDTAEGHLFPSTYQLFLDSEPAEVVRTLVREADRRYRQVAAAHPRGLAALEALGMNRRKILTLASMVEKEAAVADERALVASVFLNRLRDPEFRRLQSDPTAMYGCLALPARIPACAAFAGKASPEINRDPANLFSTYVTDGLPPGPIANPGEAALAAVFAPADTRYRYFVAKGRGRHTFSETYEQHLAAVKELRERHD